MNLAHFSPEKNNTDYLPQPTAKVHSFVLAESFDAMPLSLYDQIEAFTAPVLEPDYIDPFTCLHCDDSGLIDAINQFSQDVLAPCPHCKVEGIPFALNTDLYCEKSGLSGQVDNQDLEQRLKAAWARLDRRAILIYRYSQMPKEAMTIWHQKHLEALQAA